MKEEKLANIKKQSNYYCRCVTSPFNSHFSLCEFFKFSRAVKNGTEKGRRYKPRERMEEKCDTCGSLRGGRDWKVVLFFITIFFFTKWSLRNAYSVWGVITPTVQRIGGAPWWTSSSASLATLLRRPKAAKCLRRRKRNLCAQNRVLFASRKLFPKMQGKYCNLHFDASICMKSEVPKEGDQYDPFEIKYDPMNFYALYSVGTEVCTCQTLQLNG